MTRFTRIIIGVIVLILSLSVSSAKVRAVEKCQGTTTGLSVTLPKYSEGMSHTITFDTSFTDDYCGPYCVTNGGSHYVKIKATGKTDDEAGTSSFFLDKDNSDTNTDNISWSVVGKKLTMTIYREEALTSSPLSGQDGDTHYVYLYVHRGGSNFLCEMGEYYTPPNDNPYQSSGCDLYVSQNRDSNQCYYYMNPAEGCIAQDEPLNLSVENLQYNGQKYTGDIWFEIGQKGGFDVAKDVKATATDGVAQASYTPHEADSYSIEVHAKVPGVNYEFYGCGIENLTVSANCPADSCNTEPNPINDQDVVAQELFDICKQVADDSQRALCEECAGGEGEDSLNGIWTAVGCIPTKPESIIRTIIKIGLSVAGGVAMVMILAASFMLSTSEGDPKKTNEAKDLLSSAVIGILFIIFSVTVLQLVGVKIFQIPGFGTGS